MDVGRAARAARRDLHGRHPLRDEVDQARHDVDGRLARHAARGRRHRGRVRHGVVGRRLHDQPAARGPHATARRGSSTSTAASRSIPSTAARRGCSCRTCTSGRARSGCAAWRSRSTTSRASGRRPATTTTATRGASSATGATDRPPADAWRTATVREVVAETPRAVTLVLDVPEWPGHRAGQHVDVRLTAEDGYQAQRSYSIASAPELDALELTVELVDDGEVSPYLVEEVRAGDQFELRGPIGGHFSLGGRRGRPAAAGRRRLGPRAADGHAAPPRRPRRATSRRTCSSPPARGGRALPRRARGARAARRPERRLDLHAHAAGRAGPATPAASTPPCSPRSCPRPTPGR